MSAYMLARIRLATGECGLIEVNVAVLGSLLTRPPSLAAPAEPAGGTR